MARRSLTRIDGEPAEDPAPARSSRPASTAPRKGPPTGLETVRRLLSSGGPQISLGAGCLTILLIFLVRGPGDGETGRGLVERATSESQEAIVATMTVPATDPRPVRRICDDEDIPDALCARSAQCAAGQPIAPGVARSVRLFLKAPPGGGCG
jgi:hypothetical protein